jgi:hypothetical protein
MIKELIRALIAKSTFKGLVVAIVTLLVLHAGRGTRVEVDEEALRHG